MRVGENPFTPTFGEIPTYMAGRDEAIDDFARAFDRDGRSPSLTTLISGARGMGKTALLALAVEEAAARGWVPVRVPALPGMLDEILDRSIEASAHLVETSSRAHITGLGIGQFLSVEWERGGNAGHSWPVAMAQVVDALNETGAGLLIAVDEVRGDLDEMVRLAATYQQFVGERKRVGLLMAGLPYHISSLMGNESSSFLRRAQRLRLGRVPDSDVAFAIEKTIQLGGRAIDDDALEHVTGAVNGFPFMLQLAGYRMWDASPEKQVISLADARKGAERARLEMADRVLEPTYRELSDGDIAFLAAMLPDGDESATSDIAKRMGKPANYASTYRRRLLEQGVIGERRRGYVGFELPEFRSYLEGMMGS